MLATRLHPTLRFLAGTALAGVLLAGGGARAAAEPSGGAGCDLSTDPWCSADGNDSGSGGRNSGAGGGSSGCSWNGQRVPCTDPQFGTYSGGGCYWKAMLPPPMAPPPGGQDPAKGAWGTKTCYVSPNSDYVTQVYYWNPNPPDAPTPAQLAQQALAKLHLLGAQIGMAPQTRGSGAVGLPVWMWTTVTPQTWGPQSASASGGTVTVTITAKASRIVWDMGDGHSATCGNPGTPYSASYGNTDSPTCGYRYAEPSSTTTHPHGRYRITATTFWTVTWSGGGQSGVLNPTSQAQSSIEIGEIQAVTQ
jgi:hypothetical protein